MASIVVVFDFDKTIIDYDSDNWVIDEFGFTDLFNQLLPIMPWNSLMDRMIKELHAQGKTIDDIAEVLKRALIHPKIVLAIKSAYALGCELRIVSDANMFFIETILEHLRLREYFSEINSNPNFGMIIDRIQASLKGKKKIIYLGDGKGHYCPILKLGEADYMMPRKNFPVWDLICRNPMVIKAEIHEWSDGEELESVLLQIINTISVEENNDNSAQFISVDCKLQTISASTHALPQAQPVPQ
ncbi:hypothetical protein CRYUN_Cryun14cG0018200 [Craigia yunnanensis]